MNKNFKLYYHDKIEDRFLNLSPLTVIGADPDSTLVLEGISDRHCRIEKTERGFLIRDLRSEAGTFVNGAQVLEAFLKPGDLVRVGEYELEFSDAEINEEELPPFLKSKNERWSLDLGHLPSMARTELPVLLLGPSGTGKELLSRQVHEMSRRRHQPFVSVNCSALSESLIESELFGHVKGSFTGATHDRLGAFEAARGGTLFLDEIGDFPASLQPKLLRALENQEIRPVGSDKTISTNVRIVAATHQNLATKVATGEFRADLYFRLNVLRLNVPALKDRMEDFENVLFGFAREGRVRFSFEAVEALKKHDWPGNIRELKNVVNRASVILQRKNVQKEHLPCLIDTFMKPETEIGMAQQGSLPIIKEIEKEMIIRRLRANKGNQRRTAEDLNLPKSTLHDRIRAYKINISDFQE